MKSFFSSTSSLFSRPSPLHSAVSQGDLSKVQQVVQTGVDVDAKDKDGSAPLHIAALRGFHTIVGELLDRQATGTSTNAAGMLPLHLAAQNGHTTVVSIVLGHRNKRDAQSKAQMVNAKDQAGCTPALLACLNGHVTLAVELIQAYGADPNATDAVGCSALMAAAQRGDTAAVAALVAAGARFDGPRLLVEGWAPLHAAAAGGHETTALWLLQAGADLLTMDNQAQTAADVALKCGHVLLYRKLREVAVQRGQGHQQQQPAPVPPPPLPSSPPQQQHSTQVMAEPAADGSPRLYPEMPPGATKYQ